MCVVCGQRGSSTASPFMRITCTPASITISNKNAVISVTCRDVIRYLSGGYASQLYAASACGQFACGDIDASSYRAIMRVS